MMFKPISWSDKEVVRIKRGNAQVFGAEASMLEVLDISKSLSQQWKQVNAAE